MENTGAASGIWRKLKEKSKRKTQKRITVEKNTGDDVNSPSCFYTSSEERRKKKINEETVGYIQCRRFGVLVF